MSDFVVGQVTKAVGEYIGGEIVGTGHAQRSKLDGVIAAWAATTGRVSNSWGRPVKGGVIADDGINRTMRYTAMDPAEYPDPTTTLIPCALMQLPSQYYEWALVGSAPVQVLTAEGHEVLRRLGDLEAFNGTRFINFTTTEPVVVEGGSGHRYDLKGGNSANQTSAFATSRF